MLLGKLWKAGIKYLRSSDYRFLIHAGLGMYNNLSDEEYLKRKFKVVMGRELDLKHPRTFNEKLQWLKLYDRKPEYTRMVDKYRVREHIANTIGEEYLIPLLGVWDSPDEIDFDALPNQFVLKCTHDSGGLVICRDKGTLNKKTAKAKLEKSLKRNYYFLHREWPYKNVKRRIIAEKHMSDNNQVNCLTDYKFYCFNGEPRFLYISKGLEDHATASISFLTLDWQFAPFERSDFKPFTKLPPKPQKFEQMVEISKTLSAGQAFLRVDLYEINGEIYFSELTFSPGAGFTAFKPEEWDYTLGSWIDLPEINR